MSNDEKRRVSNDEKRRVSNDEKQGIARALQGGGAHGAFAWGVLDRMLERGVVPATVRGVSSGAIVGTMLVQGLVRGGPEGARLEIRFTARCAGSGRTCKPARHSSTPWFTLTPTSTGRELTCPSPPPPGTPRST